MTTRSEATLAAGPLDRLVRRLPRTIVADPPWWPSLHRNYLYVGGRSLTNGERKKPLKERLR